MLVKRHSFDNTIIEGFNAQAIHCVCNNVEKYTQYTLSTVNHINNFVAEMSQMNDILNEICHKTCFINTVTHLKPQYTQCMRYS